MPFEALRRWLCAPIVQAMELREVRLQVIADELSDTYRKLRAWEMRIQKGGNHARMEVRDDGDLNDLLRSRKGFQ